SLDLFPVLRCTYPFPTRCSSALLVHRSGGNTALSITLTSIATLLSVVLTPFILLLYSRYIFNFERDIALDIDIASMVGILFQLIDRKSTRLNSSHVKTSYAVLC